VHGFEVDLFALRQVGRGMSDTVSGFGGHRVRDGMPSAEALAHDGLADALEEFAERWERGIEVLRADGEQFGTRIADTADAYEQADEQAAGLFAAILRRLDGAAATSGGQGP
jgi:hypothetical protein